MANPLKSIVSKQRKRYTDDGFNLDLAYIDENIIAMGFPADKIEGVYRNNIGDVIKFLETKHNATYKIYNLCSERSYDKAKFQNVATYPFADHNPPCIELIEKFCQDVHEWLSVNKNNVAAVHCKAGKGRTGTMICCYMLYSGKYKTAKEALQYYGQKRAHDEKGVTIPSQRRYVEYFEHLKKNNIRYQRVSLQIVQLKLTPPFHSSHQGAYYYSIHTYTDPISEIGCHNKANKVHNAPVPDFKKSSQNGSEPGCIVINLDLCIPLTGEVKVEFYCKNMMKKQKLFHFWFNTFLASELANVDKEGNLLYSLSKLEIDDAHKDKAHRVFPDNFKVAMILSRCPPTLSKRFSQPGMFSHHQANNQQLENSNHTNHNHLMNSNKSTNGGPDWLENGAAINTSNLNASGTAAYYQQPASATNSEMRTLNNQQQSPHSVKTPPNNSDAQTPCESSTSSSESSNEEWDSGKPSDNYYTQGKNEKSLKCYGDEDNYYYGGATGTTSSAQPYKNPSSYTNRQSCAMMTHNDKKKSNKLHCISAPYDFPDLASQRKNSLARKKIRSNSSVTKPMKIKINSTNTSTTVSSVSPSQPKMMWLKSKRSDSDFCAQLHHNVLFKQTASTATIMKNSNDSLNSDFYSALCDKKLSVGSSPAKSPRHMFQLNNRPVEVNNDGVTQKIDPPKSSIVTAKCNTSKTNVGFDVARQRVKATLDNNILSSLSTTGKLRPKNENNSFKNFFSQFTRKDNNPSSQLVKSVSLSNVYLAAQQQQHEKPPNTVSPESSGFTFTFPNVQDLKIDDQQNTQPDLKEKK